MILAGLFSTMGDICGRGRQALCEESTLAPGRILAHSDTLSCLPGHIYRCSSFYDALSIILPGLYVFRALFYSSDRSRPRAKDFVHFHARQPLSSYLAWGTGVGPSHMKFLLLTSIVIGMCKLIRPYAFLHGGVLVATSGCFLGK